MSPLAASLAIQPKALGFTADDDIIISGVDKEKNLVENIKGSFSQIQLETMIPFNTGTKLVRFSSTGNILITVTNDDIVTLLHIRDWSTLLQIKPINDIHDIDIDTNEEHLSICTPTTLLILSIQDKQVVQVIDSPTLHKRSTSFATCRYASDPEGQERLFGVVNTLNGHGFLCLWEIRARGFVQYPTTKVRNLAISRSKITAFEVSTRGDVLAYGSKDGNIGLVDIKQLRPIRRFHRVHQGDIVNMSFNYSDKYVASIGDDNECRVTSLTSVNKSPVSGLSTLVFVILDMVLFAFMMHLIVQMVDQGTLILPLS
ncbi:WD40 repeat-like protein [Backusella circina FSU 941]|nr:WD40 repeat-like protein [Backusella circina FSU 941]